MTGFPAALRVETRKAAAALVLRVAGASLALGTAVLAAAMVAAVETGNEQIAAKLGPFAEAAGWDLLIAIATQVVAAGALLAFGTTLGWTFGREFTDGTINGLVATPAAWAATLGRGPLPGVAAAVALIVTAQVAVVAFPAQGAWLPFAAPALWAMQPIAVTGVQLLLTPTLALAFTALTAGAWRRLQLDLDR